MDYINRMIEEREDLKNRLDRAIQYFTYEAQRSGNIDLLGLQIDIIRAYIKILDMRIDNAINQK